MSKRESKQTHVITRDALPRSVHINGVDKERIHIVPMKVSNNDVQDLSIERRLGYNLMKIGVNSKQFPIIKIILVACNDSSSLWVFKSESGKGDRDVVNEEMVLLGVRWGIKRAENDFRDRTTLHLGF